MKVLMHHLNTAPLAPSQATELPIPWELDEFMLGQAHLPERTGPLTVTTYKRQTTVVVT